ncbi:pyrroline-5-carboxylate reductase [Luteimonas abyssi]|uniref:pyrroline-5-carboxylate reductase n=1 Tax=Luteimonas abyssi TaxID=1247514 RepID=UPI000737BCBB|nr:pyrroline-5-carboxylate reductase [Luteimonas abyssi]
MTTPTPTPALPAHHTLAFIGGGNMARSLIGGLIAGGIAPERIRVADPGDAKRQALENDFGVRTFATAAEAIEGADIWVMSVKPQVMREVCASLVDEVRTGRPLVISVAAGITTAQIERWLGGDAAVVRSMPNTPSLLGAGMTGLYATPQVDAGGRARADAVLSAVGRTAWVDDEALMDAVTGISGSGPAYVFLFAEAMEAAGLAQGLPAATTRALVKQTLLGAARMIDESGDAPDVLRKNVTSPNGTTQAALETFEAGGLRALVADAVAAARRRGGELSAAND